MTLPEFAKDRILSPDKGETMDDIDSPTKFLIERPLYSKMKFDPENEEHVKQIREILSFKGPIDAYCPECKKETTYRSFRASGGGAGHAPLPVTQQKGIINDTYWVELACSRDHAHKLLFAIKTYNGNVQKIGQYPSIQDMSEQHLSRYKSVLSPSHFIELKTAVSLSAHGIGIGSFVYLRRIFENLVEEAHEIKKITSGWDESTYRKSKMSEKIELLKDALPDFLVANRGLYSVMSKGLHELTEKECIEIFPVIKTGIELILDEHLSTKQKDAKIKEASVSIAHLVGEHRHK